MEMENVLKLKMELLYKIVLSDNWFNGEQIFLSARNPTDENSFCINNPKFDNEMGESRFIDINMSRKEFSFNELDLDIPTFLIHFLIYNSDKAHQCIVFINDINVVEISRSEHGLLPISQESLLIQGSEIGIFDFSQFCNEFIEITNSKSEDSLYDLLSKYQSYFDGIKLTKKKLFLKNLGCLIVGESVEDAWYEAFILKYACMTQTRFGADFKLSELVRASERSQGLVRQLNSDSYDVIFMNNPVELVDRRRGLLEFDAMARAMEARGVSPGYDYNHRAIFLKQLR